MDEYQSKSFHFWQFTLGWLDSPMRSKNVSFGRNKKLSTTRFPVHIHVFSQNVLKLYFEKCKYHLSLPGLFCKGNEYTNHIHYHWKATHWSIHRAILAFYLELDYSKWVDNRTGVFIQPNWEIYSYNKIIKCTASKFKIHSLLSMNMSNSKMLYSSPKQVWTFLGLFFRDYNYLTEFVHTEYIEFTPT